MVKRKKQNPILGGIAVIALILFVTAFYFVSIEFIQTNALTILSIAGATLTLLVLVGQASLAKILKKILGVFN